MHLYYRTIELFDVVAENGTVYNDNFPIQVRGAVGGFLNHPLVCGGQSVSYTDQCYLIGDNDHVAVTMTEKRGFAAFYSSLEEECWWSSKFN